MPERLQFSFDETVELQVVDGLDHLIAGLAPCEIGEDFLLSEWSALHGVFL